MAYFKRAHVVDRQVMVKLKGPGRVMTGTCAGVEDDGFWIMGKDIAEELHKGGFPPHMKQPVVFVPDGSLDWLMTPHTRITSPRAPSGSADQNQNS
jgi:hypothetical protein